MRQVKQAVDPDNLFGAANHGVLGEIALSRRRSRGERRRLDLGGAAAGQGATLPGSAAPAASSASSR